MRAAGILLHLLVDPLRYVRGQDLHESGGGQSPHGVVLDGSPGQVRVRHEGKVVDSPAGVLWLVSAMIIDHNIT